MEREMDIFSAERNLQVIDVDAVKVAPHGLGFGEGGISLNERHEELGAETLQKIDDLVNSSEILIPISKDKVGNMLDDDGCGDGREVAKVYEGREERAKSLDRSKVFGGGVTMAASARIGLGQADGKPLRDVFSDGIASLRDKMINFGAHTDTHAEHHDKNSGCGAIDKAPIILNNAVKYQSEIRETIQALGIDLNGLDEVQKAYSDYASSDIGDYAGKDVMNEIVDNGKIVKQLADDHKEVTVVLNLVDGYTVDQDKVRGVTGGQAQAFGVDVWRVKQLADRLYADASDEIRHKAFLSELVFTLATAGTLTAGDLPVYVVNKQENLITA